MNIISSIKEYNINRVLKAIKRRVVIIPHRITWLLPFKFTKENKRNLKKFKDLHIGHRCFIIANGPSLQKTDLSLLKNEYTIGMNRIYLLEKETGFRPTYLVVSDIEVQLNQFTDEYDNLKIQKFFPWETRNKFNHSDNIYFFKTKFAKKFSNDFSNFVGSGKSVTVACVQLAYYMGFKEVILVGKDHFYKHKSDEIPGSIIKSNGKEMNHFIKGYYKEGMKWAIPSYKEEEYAYIKAKNEFEKSNRVILDATIGGKLEIFKKIDYTSIFRNEEKLLT